jgi:AraC-like DNA-binding protein
MTLVGASEFRDGNEGGSHQIAGILAVRSLLDRTPTFVPLTVLCGVAQLSKWQLVRQFRRHVGLPPHAYHRHQRLCSARALLELGTPVAEVAYATGFADQSHFTRQFKDHFGVTPGALTRAAQRQPRPVATPPPPTTSRGRLGSSTSRSAPVAPSDGRS